MISDMGGAANVVGALQAVASLGLPLVILNLFWNETFYFIWSVFSIGPRGMYWRSFIKNNNTTTGSEN